MPNTAYTFQYTCRLCQQTPLMHFQYREPGATLRVPQVKPALERYLRRRYGDRPIPESWLHNKTRLDFQLTLVAAEPPRVLEVGVGTPYAIFYSNVYTPNTRKAVVGDCLMTITCFEPTLMAFIKEHVGDFFAVTNFGALKSKGFGSYLPQGMTPSPAEVSRLLRQQYGATACYGFVTAHREQVFEQINTLYRVIKGGIHTPPRRRSLLDAYVDEVYGWDNERTMIKDAGVVARPVKRRHREGRYVRVLLGMPEAYRFGTDANAQSVAVRCAAAGLVAGRVDSPLFFKVIGDRVYLVGTRLPEALYGAPFRFQNKVTHRQTVLTAPTRQELGEDFLGRFLAYCATHLSGEHNRLRGLPYMDGVELKEVTV